MKATVAAALILAASSLAAPLTVVSTISSLY
jgi:hypothetical protein